MCLHPYLESPVGPSSEAGFTHLRRAVSSTALLPSSHKGGLRPQGGALPTGAMELPVPKQRAPPTVGTAILHNGQPSSPPPALEAPGSAYQLLDALGNGFVPGADDGLRIMLDQVL